MIVINLESLLLPNKEIITFLPSVWSNRSKNFKWSTLTTQEKKLYHNNV